MRYSEGSAARFAARHATEPEIEILYSVQNELARAEDDALTLAKLNLRFHNAVYEASHNRYLMEALNTLNLDSLALLHSTTFRAPRRRRETDEEHRRIVVAIELHDTDAAEKNARDHIRQAQRTRLGVQLQRCGPRFAFFWVQLGCGCSKLRKAEKSGDFCATAIPLWGMITILFPPRFPALVPCSQPNLSRT